MFVPHLLETPSHPAVSDAWCRTSPAGSTALGWMSHVVIPCVL